MTVATRRAMFLGTAACMAAAAVPAFIPAAVDQEAMLRDLMARRISDFYAAIECLKKDIAENVYSIGSGPSEGGLHALLA